MTPDPAQTAINPFLYGWRYRKRTLPDGSETVDQVPLTLEDVLHPEQGDVIPERHLHEIERTYLSEVFRSRLPGLHGGCVFSDLLINWGVPGVRNHSPDISVFADLSAPTDPNTGIFDLKESGGRCVFVIELVSPHTRENDVVAKMKEYHQVEVPFYVLVDQEEEGGPRKLLAYEHTPGGYIRVPLTDRGRVELAPLGLCLGLGENRVVCYDTVTGEEMGDDSQDRQGRKEAERRASAAEERANEEAQARAAAEQRLRDADQLVQQMQAELRRLRGQDPHPRS